MSDLEKTAGKQFIIQRVLSQAKLDGIQLAEIEQRMLGFAEEKASKQDMETVAVFDRDYDREKYERKVADLLRRAYQSDKSAGKQDEWDLALMDLGDDDMYLKVLLDRARSHDPFLRRSQWWMLLGTAPIALLVAVAFVIAFTPTGARLIPSETLRLAVYVLALAVPFLIINRRRRPD